MKNYAILTTAAGGDYALLDSGDGEKLERYGEVTVARPDPQALWKKRLPESEWNKADGYFRREQTTANPSVSPLGKGGRRTTAAEWQTRKKLPERWVVEIGGLKMWIKLSAFKHTGVFPEQAGNWEWIGERIKNEELRMKNGRSGGQHPPATPLRGGIRVLNLFGYTGGASLAAAKAGAPAFAPGATAGKEVKVEVVHVDGSKVAIGWARDNAKLSGLSDKPIRWILDDARSFVKREIKRGNKYDGIIMDPPAFGHGPGGELWKVEDHFLELLDLCKQVLSDRPLFFIINGYASGYSAVAYKNSLGDLMEEHGGEIEIGELTIAEKDSQRLLPAGIFARWARG